MRRNEGTALRLLVFCAPDTAEAVDLLNEHETFLILDVNQAPNGLRPMSVLLLDFALKQDMNAIMAELKQIEEFAADIARDHGPIDRIVSFNEATNAAAGHLRERLRIDGDDARTAARFRDKLVMRDLFVQSGVRAPLTLSVPELRAEPASLPAALIVKPRDQAASRGVRRVQRSELDQVLASTDSAEDLLIQEFVEGDYYHIDAVFRRDVLSFISVSRYLRHGLDWASGASPMASVSENDPAVAAAAIDLAAKIGVGFEVGDRVVHLEAFRTAAGEFVAIELASRPGGALIVPAIEAAGGPNLEAECIRLQLLEDTDVTTAPPAVSKPDAHGWVVTPLPGFGPFVVTGDNSTQLDLPHAPVIAIVPSVGDVLHDRYRYRNTQGKFAFLGTGATGLINAVVDQHRLELAPVTVGLSDYWLD